MVKMTCGSGRMYCSVSRLILVRGLGAGDCGLGLPVALFLFGRLICLRVQAMLGRFERDVLAFEFALCSPGGPRCLT
jgi:hypothetical protein